MHGLCNLTIHCHFGSSFLPFRRFQTISDRSGIYSWCRRLTGPIVNMFSLSPSSPVTGPLDIVARANGYDAANAFVRNAMINRMFVLSRARFFACYRQNHTRFYTTGKLSVPSHHISIPSSCQLNLLAAAEVLRLLPPFQWDFYFHFYFITYVITIEYIGSCVRAVVVVQLLHSPLPSQRSSVKRWPS